MESRYRLLLRGWRYQMKELVIKINSNMRMCDDVTLAANQTRMGLTEEQHTVGYVSCVPASTSFLNNSRKYIRPVCWAMLHRACQRADGSQQHPLCAVVTYI